jgi:hypothetical protein
MGPDGSARIRHLIVGVVEFVSIERRRERIFAGEGRHQLPLLQYFDAEAAGPDKFIILNARRA